MPEVIRIHDCEDLVSTKEYPFAKWEFDKFNPVQSRLMETFEGESNVAIAAATAAGKTVCSEMYLAYEMRKRGGKGIYVGPLKALASEKQQDWTSGPHHFSDLNTSILTGDFRLTSSRIAELDASDLIVMTPEMLASRCRNHKSEKSNFLKEVGTVVFDESHLLTVPGRGDHIEVALMKLVDINPDVRIVLLSATMPNVDEICGWISDLTGRNTYFLESEYRPCPLNIHYESYYDGDRSYYDREIQKVGAARAIVEDYPDDKFLIFVHTFDTGYEMLRQLKRSGINAEFHNSLLNFKQRHELEEKFKGKDLRIVVATSSLAWGVNLPSRRVIVTGVHRGLGLVENYDIQQMIGRAGRPKYDPVGDAYILVPDSEKRETIARLKKKSVIKSTLLNYVGTAENPHYKTLAFHVVSEIHRGSITTKEGFKEWFRKSLACYQDGMDESAIEKTLELLMRYRAISVESGEYKSTAIGMVASMYYYSPFDVADLRRNFKFVFEKNRDHDDISVAMALGNIDSFRFNTANRNEREQMASFEVAVKKMFGDASFSAGAIKMGYAYYNMLKGKKDAPAYQGIQQALSVDLDRTMQVIQGIDSMSARWEKKDYWNTLRLRLRYGVEADLVQLCQIPNVGQARGKRLKEKKIRTVEDFVSYDADQLAKIMKCSKKLAEEALDGAKMIQLKESLG